MTTKTLTYLFIISILLISMAFTLVRTKSDSTDSSDWKLVKAENNIKIYTRNSDGSKIKEFKAITTITAKMELLENLIDKISEYPTWQANIATAKVLKQVNKETQYIYYTTSVPWPLTNRDVVLFSEKIVDIDGTITYNLTGKPDYIKEKVNFIRVKNIKSMCKIKPIGNNKIEITFESFGDPEGVIPDSIINMFMADSPYNTLVNLRKIVENKNHE